MIAPAPGDAPRTTGGLFGMPQVWMNGLRGSMYIEHGGAATAVPGAAILAAAANAPVAISTADPTVASLRYGVNIVTTFPNAYCCPTSGLMVH
jgi:hypothetical protein